MCVVIVGGYYGGYEVERDIVVMLECFFGIVSVVRFEEVC